MYKTNRSGFIAFLLNIVTIGIFGLIQIHQLAKELNETCKEDKQKTKGLLALILLNLITFGIYAIIWKFSVIGRMENKQRKHNVPVVLKPLTWLIVSLFLSGPTLGIWPLINYFKFYKSWNITNILANAELEAQQSQSQV